MVRMGTWATSASRRISVRIDEICQNSAEVKGDSWIPGIWCVHGFIVLKLRECSSLLYHFRLFSL